jgi:hypothetical protein
MAEYSEVFVAFDVAKRKHAVAIAEGGRTGEVRFLGEIENSAATIERVIKRLAGRYDPGLFNAQYMTRMARIALMPPKAMRCRPSETL